MTTSGANIISEGIQRKNDELLDGVHPEWRVLVCSAHDERGQERQKAVAGAYEATKLALREAHEAYRAGGVPFNRALFDALRGDMDESVQNRLTWAGLLRHLIAHEDYQPDPGTAFSAVIIFSGAWARLTKQDPGLPRIAKLKSKSAWGLRLLLATPSGAEQLAARLQSVSTAQPANFQKILEEFGLRTSDLRAHPEYLGLLMQLGQVLGRMQPLWSQTVDDWDSRASEYLSWRAGEEANFRDLPADLDGCLSWCARRQLFYDIHGQDERPGAVIDTFTDTSSDAARVWKSLSAAAFMTLCLCFSLLLLAASTLSVSTIGVLVLAINISAAVGVWSHLQQAAIRRTLGSFSAIFE